MILFENDIYPTELFVSYFVAEKTRQEVSNITIDKTQFEIRHHIGVSVCDKVYEQIYDLIFLPIRREVFHKIDA
jgi:hypothetical protein